MKPIRLLFDECIGKPIMEQLAQAVQYSHEDIEFKHLLDFQSQGIPDSDWIPQKANEGWILISTDRGKKTGAGGAGHGKALPMLCRRFGMTHVLLSAKVHAKKQFDKMRAILDVWDDLVRVIDAEPGSQFLIRMGPKHAVLERRNVPEPTPQGGHATETPSD
ncbi:MAG: hypothetical protein V1790_04885 [Planctomycetota bacterium]